MEISRVETESEMVGFCGGGGWGEPVEIVAIVGAAIVRAVRIETEDDFFKILDLDDETFEEVEGDADSLAGLLLEIKGDFPELHERIDFQNYTFEVTELDEHRISKIKVVIHS